MQDQQDDEARDAAVQRAQTDRARSHGRTRQAEMNHEMYAAWGYPPQLRAAMCAGTDRSAAEAREQARRSKVRATHAVAADWRAREQRPVLTASRERRPGRTRRTSSSSTTAAQDPGDSDSDGEPAAATLRVRRPSGATATFHATACTIRAGVVTAIGSWADLPGTRTYSWPARRVLQVRWLEVVA